MLLNRNPAAEPPFRMPGFIIAVCVFLVLFGGAIALTAAYLWASGAPVSGGPGSRGRMPHWAAVLLGIGLACSPYFIYRQERASAARLRERITLTRTNLKFLAGPVEYAVPWNHLLGVRAAPAGKGRMELEADVREPIRMYRTGHAVVFGARRFSGIVCEDPVGAAGVLEFYRLNPARRGDLGSRASADEANALAGTSAH